MARFDRYMLSQLMVIFGFSSIILVLIYWINRAVRLFDWLIASGQSASVFVEFTALTLPNVIRVVLPVSAFAATLYTTNRLSSESELVVVQATGYGPFRLARPVFVFGLLISLFLSLLVHFAVPASFARLSERQVEVAENVTARILVEGRFVHPVDGMTLYIRQITGSGELQDVYVRDSRKPERHVTYTATRALLVRTETGPRLVMFDGMAQTLRTGERALSVTRFSELSIDVASLLEGNAGTGGKRRNVRELSTAELLRADPATVEELRSTEGRLRIEGHQRFSQPLVALTAPLIGFATLLLGGFSRFGIWNQIFGAIVLVVALYIADNAVADLALSRPESWPLVYLPPFLGLILAAGLLWLASNPQVLHRRPRGPAA